MKKFNLDGVITDYPDRAIKIFRKKSFRVTNNFCRANIASAISD
jgi:hypothetical protein